MAKKDKQQEFVTQITPRSEDFSKWYTDVILRTDMVDYAPVRGCMVIKPYGYAVWELIQKAFDAEFCCAGKEAVKRKIREIENNKDATAVEKDMLTTLEVCYEFYLRGFHFDTISIYESDATKFKVTENGLLPPFTTVHGLGEAAAIDTVEKRKGKQFISIEEFSMCCNKLSKTHIEQLKALGAFAGMAETRQMTLF